jgi:hypothetical protein
MKTKLLVLMLLVNIITTAQDTISVQTFTYDSISTRRATFDFPSTLQGETFEKVFLYYNLKCSPQTPWDSYNCGEWDYLTNTTIYEHTGDLDSNKIEGPQYLVNNEFIQNIEYSSTPYYHYLENYQYFINTTTVSESDFLIGTGTDLSSVPFGTSNEVMHTQLLWTATELSNAGVTAGNIDKLRFDLATNGSAMGHLVIKMKHASNADLSVFDLDTWTTVYDFNTDFLASGLQTLNLTFPFMYDGTDGILLDISYENNVAGTDNVLNATNTVNNSVITTNEKLGYLNIVQGEYVEIDLDNFDFQDEITISFWANGDASVLPANTSVFEGRDSLNNRVLNSHFPWNNSDFYWDAGAGAGNDRIQKSASAAEISGEWNHWAFTKNTTSGIMNIYKNGSLWHSGSNLNREVGVVNKFRLGTSVSGGYNYAGKIDEFRVWNSELNGATISTWMDTKIDGSHPNYADLVLYYDFDNDQAVIDRTVNNRDGMMTTPGMIKFYEDAPVAFEISTLRPNVTFVQGSYTTFVDSVLVTDSVLVNSIDVLEYAVDGRKFVINQIDNVYPTGYSYTYNYLGNKTADSVLIAADVTILNDSIFYYQAPFEIINEFEIGRFITPYGIGFDLGPDGFTWVYEVTDYQKLLLTDMVDLRVHNTQELIDIRFDFITGTPPRDVVDIETLWNNYGSHKYGDIVDDVKLSAIDVDLNPNAENYKLKTRITGHGHEGNGNCCEWQSKEFGISVDGTEEYSWSIWRPTACGDNPNVSQGGTWPYAREGWCPGDVVPEYDFELTPNVTPGTTVSLDYGIDAVPGSDAGQANGNYVISTQLVSYGAPNFSIDASVIDVLNPNDWEYYGKWNPNCQNPTVIIKNTGSTTLTSAKITIWVGEHDWTDVTFDWTGSLEFLEEATIEIPVQNNFWFEDIGDGNRFHAKISEPNGTADEYANNDQYNVTFSNPDVINDPFYIWFKTNNKANENDIYLKDGNGDVIWSRTTLANSTEYKDTFDLAPGCYSIELYDSDNDGISFWYSAQVEGETAGFLRLRKVGGFTFENFETDFGNYVKYNFTVGFSLETPEEELNYNFEVFPNPSTGVFNLALDNFTGEEVIIEVYNELGQKMNSFVRQNDNVEGYMKTQLDLSNLVKGVYYLKVQSDNRLQTKSIVIQ